MPSEPTVPITSGPPRTVLPQPPPDAAAGLAEAARLPGATERRAALAEVVARHPTLLAGWSALSRSARDPVEAYAYARVGYHRGLDALRQAGWRGSGYVRWRDETNRGFLESLDSLRATAAIIGETEEEQRCAVFLRQLDPEWGADGPADLPPTFGK